MIKGYIIKPFMVRKEQSEVYHGCVFGLVAGENGVATKLDIRTSHVVEYDINAEQSEVMVKTRSGSNYKILLDDDEEDRKFVRDLLNYMGEK